MPPLLLRRWRQLARVAGAPQVLAARPRCSGAAAVCRIACARQVSHAAYAHDIPLAVAAGAGFPCSYVHGRQDCAIVRHVCFLVHVQDSSCCCDSCCHGVRARADTGCLLDQLLLP